LKRPRCTKALFVLQILAIKPQGGLTWFQLKAGEDAFLWAEVGLR
jgi:hypothetical protein